jgi:hypothetical protein
MGSMKNATEISYNNKKYSFRRVLLLNTFFYKMYILVQKINKLIFLLYLLHTNINLFLLFFLFFKLKNKDIK